jgi:hypothetical protein
LRRDAPSGLILAPRDDQRAFTDRINQWIASRWKNQQHGREEMEGFFERHFAWPVIARKTLERLQD